MLNSEFLVNFAIADRIAYHASRERFVTELTPGQGLSGAGCVDGAGVAPGNKYIESVYPR